MYDTADTLFKPQNINQHNVCDIMSDPQALCIPSNVSHPRVSPFILP